MQERGSVPEHERMIHLQGVHQGVESGQERRGQITYPAIVGPGFDVEAAEGPAGVDKKLTG